MRKLNFISRENESIACIAEIGQYFFLLNYNMIAYQAQFNAPSIMPKTGFFISFDVQSSPSHPGRAGGWLAVRSA
ncbi:hypothetical protein [Allofranklinella schreckenbergeri]|uniref:hypothetical protein n=1 Tax=Allofranklinella schreckenbergeri TaxID=1076744 RepID=UPI0011C3445B|nr:hypothetical protein [Allofranklinella schreckenbergeri]